MQKRLALTLMLATLAVAPFLSSVQADANGFTPLQANGAWNYGSYRVEKLAFSDGAIGPFTLGNTVFVAEPTAEAGVYDLTLIKNGAGKMIPNVPASAFDAKRFAMNGDRLVFARPTSFDRSRYDVVEVSLATGDETTLASDVFAENATKVSIVVNGDIILFEFEYNSDKPGFHQQGVFIWDPAEHKAYPITQHWELNREEIQDSIYGFVLVKMTFPGGNSQLWFMHGYTFDGYRGAMEAIPGTWTDAKEDIVGAHYRADGTLEYFRNYTRTTFNVKDNPPVAHDGDTITWFRDVKTAYQSDIAHLAWIDATDGVHLSDFSGKSQAFGTASFGRFHMENGKLYFATDHAGKVVSLQNGAYVTTDLPVGITDVSGSRAVGINGEHQVATLDLTTGIAHDVGTGYSPVIDADGRAYWHGMKAGIYAVVFTGKLAATVPKVSLKDASGHFVRGSLVKFSGKKTVYVVGSDRRLSSIPNETVAQVLFGIDWNHHITEVTDTQMIDYPLGGVVNTADDLAKI